MHKTEQAGRRWGLAGTLPQPPASRCTLPTPPGASPGCNLSLSLHHPEKKAEAPWLGWDALHELAQACHTVHLSPRAHLPHSSPPPSGSEPHKQASVCAAWLPKPLPPSSCGASHFLGRHSFAQPSPSFPAREGSSGLTQPPLYLLLHSAWKAKTLRTDPIPIQCLFVPLN